MLLLSLYRALKSKEPLSFDSPAETEVVRRPPTPDKGFVAEIEPEASRTARARSSQSAIMSIYIYMKGSMRASYDGLDMRRRWRRIGLPR